MELSDNPIPKFCNFNSEVMRHFFKIFIVIAITCSSNVLFAQDPSQLPIEGSKSYGSGINIDSCRINILTVGYKLAQVNGQPIVYSNVKWKGKQSTSNCLSDLKFDMFLSIGTDSVPRYIHAGSSAEVVAGNGNHEWGTHPFSGTISWDKLISKNFGKANNLNFYPAEEAQAIWNAGIVVKTVKLVTDNGKVFIMK